MGESADFVESFRRGVQNGRETIAKAFDDTAGEGWADAFDLGGEVAFQRGDAGGPNRLEVIDAELLAIAGVFLEAAGQAEARANLDAAQVSDDGDAAACPIVVAAFDRIGLCHIPVGTGNTLRETDGDRSVANRSSGLPGDARRETGADEHPRISIAVFSGGASESGVYPGPAARRGVGHGTICHAAQRGCVCAAPARKD